MAPRYVTIEKQSGTPTPPRSSNDVKVYAGTDAALHTIDSQGTVADVGGGGGSLPVGASGVYAFTGTFTAAEFSAIWDTPNGEAALELVDLLEGDLLIGWWISVTEAFDVTGALDLPVVDAGPGSWANPFACNVAGNTAGDTGPGFITASGTPAADTGSIITAAKTLYVRVANPTGAPTMGSCTVAVILVRAA